MLCARPRQANCEIAARLVDSQNGSFDRKVAKREFAYEFATEQSDSKFAHPINLLSQMQWVKNAITFACIELPSWRLHSQKKHLIWSKIGLLAHNVFRLQTTRQKWTKLKTLSFWSVAMMRKKCAYKTCRGISSGNNGGKTHRHQSKTNHYETICTWFNNNWHI